MRKQLSGPTLANDLHTLAGLYLTLFREMRKQAKHGHALPPHRHALAAPRQDQHSAGTFSERR